MMIAMLTNDDRYAKYPSGYLILAITNLKEEWALLPKSIASDTVGRVFQL